ncbi:MAG: glycosyltransferase family 39 protein [Ardenticatenaceae bacterium]|nr:glycosyltransferase family 39 protein [Ardenticatenaceae bacterium]
MTGKMVKVNNWRVVRNCRSLLIFLIYALLTPIMTWPTVAKLGQAIPGQLGDSFVHLWIFEWLKSALLSGSNLLQTQLIFYPTGVSLLNHNIAWVNFALWLPLQALFGGEIGYSLSFLLIFPLNGLAVYLLVKEIIKDETAAFVAGLIAAFWPYNLSHHDHPNLILIAWLPLAILFMARLVQRHRWTDAVLAGLFVALIGLTRWQLLLMAAPLLGLWGVWLLAQNHPLPFKTLLPKVILAGATMLLLILPFFVPLLRYQLNRNNPQEVLVEEHPYATDLAAYVMPGSYHPLWGDAVMPVTQGFEGNPIYVRFVGFTVLILAGLGVWRQWHKSRLWLLATAVYLLFALGPTLFIAGSPTIPLPYRLIESSFLVQTIRFPDRFNVLLGIPLSVLAGLGIVAVRQRPFPKRHFTITTLLITTLILFEYANQVAMLSLSTPKWFQQIAKEDAEFAILDIPAFSNEAYNKQYMRYQLIHQKALVEGRIARPPESATEFWEDLPILDNLLTSKLPPANLVNQSQQIQQLAEANVEYIVLHRQFLSPEEQTAWRNWFVRQPIYEGENVIVFATERLALGTAVPWQIQLHHPGLEGEFGLLKMSYPNPVTAGNWLTLQAIWGSSEPINQALDVCLQLQNVAVQQCQPISQTWPTPQWQADEIVRELYQLQIDPFAAGGTYALTVQLSDSAHISSEATPIGTVEVTAISRDFSPGQPQFGQTAVWHNLIQLNGYDLNQSETQLDLTLHWQALTRPDRSYKFFVHLIDVKTGELVAQADYVPRNWTYPTNWWEAGEYVVDTAVLPLENGLNGTYQLLVGLYDPENGERLLATTATNSDPVDTVLLSETLTLGE